MASCTRKKKSFLDHQRARGERGGWRERVFCCARGARCDVATFSTFTAVTALRLKRLSHARVGHVRAHTAPERRWVQLKRGVFRIAFPRAVCSASTRITPCFPKKITTKKITKKIDQKITKKTTKYETSKVVVIATLAHHLFSWVVLALAVGLAARLISELAVFTLLAAHLAAHRAAELAV